MEDPLRDGSASPGTDPASAEVVIVERDPSNRYSRYTEILGRGAFKTVYKAFDDEEGIEVAWNQVRATDFVASERDADRLRFEVEMLRNLDHPCLMKFYDSWVDPAQLNINFITELFTSGTLRQYRMRHKNLDDVVIQRWGMQILKGLMYLHGHSPPIIHRDLKCDNIFINGTTGEVKIGDLGLATVMQPMQSAPRSVLGTPEYMAPELYDEHYDQKVDIWAFGMCMLELATLEYPYAECRNAAQVYKKVCNGILPKQIQDVENERLKEFIEVCLERDPQKRPTAQRLLRHPFLAEVNPDQHRSSMDSRSSSSEDLFASRNTPDRARRLTNGRSFEHLASLGEDDEVFVPPEQPLSRHSSKSLELYDSADDADGLSSGENSARHGGGSAAAGHGHKVLPTSNLHMMAASPPLGALDELVSPSFSNSSPDSSLRRSGSIKAIDDVKAKLPAGIRQNGRQWAVEVVHDNGLIGADRMLQLRFSGFQDGVAFNNFECNFPAEASNEDYQDFATEVMSDVGISQEDATTILNEIRLTVSAALLRDTGERLGPLREEPLFLPQQLDTIAPPGTESGQGSSPKLDRLVSLAMPMPPQLPVLETRKVLPRADSSFTGAAYTPTTSHYMEALETSSSYGSEGYSVLHSARSSAVEAPRVESAPIVNAAGITVVSQTLGFSVGMQPGASSSTAQQQQQGLAGGSAPAGGSGRASPDAELLQASARPPPRPLMASGLGKVASKPPPANGAAVALQHEEANGTGSNEEGDDDDDLAEERKIKAKQQSRIQKMLKKKSTANPKKPSTTIMSSSPGNDVSPKVMAGDLSAHRSSFHEASPSEKAERSQRRSLSLNERKRSQNGE